MTDSEIVERIIEIRHDLSEGKYNTDLISDGDVVGERINRNKLAKDLDQLKNDLSN